MPVIFKVFPSRYYDNCNIPQMIENSLLRFCFLEEVSAYHKSTVTIRHAFIDLLSLWENFIIYNFISNLAYFYQLSDRIKLSEPKYWKHESARWSKLCPVRNQRPRNHRQSSLRLSRL